MSLLTNCAFRSQPVKEAEQALWITDPSMIRFLQLRSWPSPTCCEKWPSDGLIAVFISSQMWHNKCGACQQNNVNFIIHVTPCNPFVFMGSREYNQISGSTMTLNYISLQSIFHLLGETYCLILLNNPSPHRHLSPPTSFFLSHYKMILFCATLVIFNGTMNI